MKYILLLLIFVSPLAQANTVMWSSQEENSVFKSVKSITLQLDDRRYEIPANTKFELYEVSDLNMIKVHLHKYKLSNCTISNVETDLQLIPVAQPNNSKTSVGVNLSKGCRLEVFIDMKEYNTYSFLK